MRGFFPAAALNFIFDIFLFAVTLCIFSELLNRIFGKSRPYKNWLQGGILLAGIIIEGSPYYELAMAEIPLFLILLPSYTGSRQKKLFFSFSLFTLWIFYLFCLNAVTNLLHHGLDLYLPFYQLQLACHLFLWLILYLCQKLCRGFAEEIVLPPSLWGFLFGFSGALFAIALWSLPLTASSTLEYSVKMWLHLGLMFLLLCLNYGVLALYKRFYLYSSTLQEEALIRQQFQYQEKYYKEYLHTSGEMRKLRHDLKNHLRTASLLYEQGKAEELKDYLDKAESSLQDWENLIVTGNSTLDAVLNLKLSEAVQKNLRCIPQLTVSENSVFLDFSDTVTIFGNLLDNAMASSLDFLVPGEEPPSIRLSLFFQEGNLLLHIDNPCKDQKKPPYGIGMKNVEQKVRKYQGTMLTEIKEGRYHTDILLYHPEKT